MRYQRRYWLVFSLFRISYVGDIFAPFHLSQCFRYPGNSMARSCSHKLSTGLVISLRSSLYSFMWDSNISYCICTRTSSWRHRDVPSIQEIFYEMDQIWDSSVYRLYSRYSFGLSRITNPLTSWSKSGLTLRRIPEQINTKRCIATADSTCSHTGTKAYVQIRVDNDGKIFSRLTLIRMLNRTRSDQYVLWIIENIKIRMPCPARFDHFATVVFYGMMYEENSCLWEKYSIRNSQKLQNHFTPVIATVTYSVKS